MVGSKKPLNLLRINGISGDLDGMNFVAGYSISYVEIENQFAPNLSYEKRFL